MVYRLSYRVRETGQERDYSLIIAPLAEARQKFTQKPIAQHITHHNIFGPNELLFKQGLVRSESPSQLDLFSTSRRGLEMLSKRLGLPYEDSKVRVVRWK